MFQWLSGRRSGKTEGGRLRETLVIGAIWHNHGQLRDSAVSLSLLSPISAHYSASAIVSSLSRVPFPQTLSTVIGLFNVHYAHWWPHLKCVTQEKLPFNFANHYWVHQSKHNKNWEMCRGHCCRWVLNQNYAFSSVISLPSKVCHSDWFARQSINTY